MLAGHFATADVYCSPATGGESFGIVLLEAMAGGAAIVASDIGGYRDVVRNGKTGILVRPRSPEEIAGAISDLWEDPERRNRLVENARRDVERYAWDRVTADIMNVYRSAAGLKEDEPTARSEAPPDEVEAEVTATV